MYFPQRTPSWNHPKNYNFVHDNSKIIPVDLRLICFLVEVINTIFHLEIEKNHLLDLICQTCLMTTMRGLFILSLIVPYFPLKYSWNTAHLYTLTRPIMSKNVEFSGPPKIMFHSCTIFILFENNSLHGYKTMLIFFIKTFNYTHI
jgi:hypothetical protein